MSTAPEAEAREKIDALLEMAGWLVQDVKAVNLLPIRALVFGNSR